MLERRARFLRGGLIAICAVLAAGLASGSTPSGDIDPSIRPADDFYGYANGAWLKTVEVPGGPHGYGTRDIVNERTRLLVRDLVQGAAMARPGRSSAAQKVGDYYASVMDEDRIEAKGLAPLADDMARISAISDRAALSTYLGSTLNSEADELTANADHVVGLWINQGFRDADHALPHLWQGGLGMPDREAYLDPSPDMAALRARYRAHIAAMLKLAGATDAEARAAHVLALETRIARAHAPDSDAADVFKQDNPWKRADFPVKAPGMDWTAYFAAAGLSGQRDFIVWQPSAVTGTAALVASEGIPAWKDYLRFHLIEHYAGVLPRAVRAEHAAFPSGAAQAPDRSAEAIAATSGALGQAVSQLYTRRYFPPAAKARAEAMSRDLLTAYRTRIAKLARLSPGTKAKALAKLAAFRIGIGYPDTWIDYATLTVARGDALGNMRRAEAFNRARNLARLKRPVDPMEWPMNPHVPGAVIMFSPNAEFFSAAILQPPYFDSRGDNAANYGSAGAGMAHEISHSFDELGNIYDARGRLGDWWTAADRARYHAATAKLAAQFDGYCPLPGLCLDGKRIVSENVADLAGLLVAHDAYILSLKGKPDVVIGGLTGEQRFFLAFAQRWRLAQSEAALRRQVTTDTHAPGQYRSDTVRNVDAWYGAYGARPGDRLYLKPEDRVRIW
ncbi:MAG: Endothelin-converting enzyme 1 [Sphingomonas bacterium]|uniref:M13 family metallopeptidase n=1 Tax=Sphingomonas bacterium TaxID=1895847 RepID=UPI00262BF6E5|nr:M13 family metallopeptidase [Sphingomonas bacterium]MDB5706382.1 Endothelin-converting enzyme 1 [Sphingomonas bacterium]